MVNRAGSSRLSPLHSPCAPAFTIVLMLAASICASSQVIHDFDNKDGNQPVTNLIFDSAGNLYGTTASGGNPACAAGTGCGTVYELSPQSGGGWKEKVLHFFNNQNGWGAFGSLVFDAAGNLYGTTAFGGVQSCQNGCGTVYKLQPQANGAWTKQVLHFFHGSEGSFPEGLLAVDSSGNVYGTTAVGGRGNDGTVFELTPQSGGTWQFKVLHSFSGPDGVNPDAGVILDDAGNLYGTALHGGSSGNGLVFELSPAADGGWTEKTLFNFNGEDGAEPIANLIFDSAGNLYGTTLGGGAYSSGTVFELTRSGSGWNETVLYSFCAAAGCPDGAGAFSGVTMDSSGNLYGTTNAGGNGLQCEFGCGVVYRLAPQSSGGWMETVLLTFNGADGLDPEAGITIGPDGNLYGAAVQGGTGANDYGTIIEVGP